MLAVLGLALVGGSLTVGSSPAAAAGGPSLGAAKSFAVLGASNVTSTGASAVKGNVGVSPGSDITGFPPATIAEGAIHAADAAAGAAHADAAIAYEFLAGMARKPANDLTGTDLGGLTLKPGVYTFNSSAELTGALKLDARGDSGAVFVFQIASTLTTASNATVTVVRGGANYDESNVYWQVGSSATLGSGTSFTGNILAYASVTMVTGSRLTGNAIALNGAVTLEAATVTAPRRGSGGSYDGPTKGKSKLTRPDGAPDRNAFAKLDVMHIPAKSGRAERSWFRLKLRHLDKSATYTLWADDPSTAAADLVQFDSVTTQRSGNFNYMKDTKDGETLPFGATLAGLAGRRIEVRVAAGTTTIVAGTMPMLSK